MASTTQIGVRVQEELLDAARHAMGKPDASTSEVVRFALCVAAGLAVANYALKRGRPFGSK